MTDQRRAPPCLARRSERAQIPLLVPLTDINALQRAGIAYPHTVHAWRWLYRNREARGLTDAFRRVGRRILVDTERYVALVRAQSQI